MQTEKYKSYASSDYNVPSLSLIVPSLSCKESNLIRSPICSNKVQVSIWAKSHRSITSKRRGRNKQPPTGWPLCARGCVIVHLVAPPGPLRAGDFYFLATPVGVQLKWRTTEGPREKSLDPREFNKEMAAMLGKASTKSSGCNFPAKSSSSDADADEESEESEDRRRTHLLVSEEPGTVGRVAVERLLEELFLEGRRRRKSKGCTRDSWVQTEGGEGASEVPQVEGGQGAEVLVAPLASEEEFCSDTEQKPKFFPLPEGYLNDEAYLPRSPLPEMRQPSAIADLDQVAVASQVATMPGSRDASGRSVVYVSLKSMQDHTVEAVQLAEMLLYFQTIPKKETMCLGFLMVVDGRDANSTNWNILHKTLALTEETIPGTISLVLLMHMQGRQSDFLSSKYPIFHIKFEPIVNENQLLKYISKDQLLPEFSGTFVYDHQEWIKFHEFLDPFVMGCHQTGCRVVRLMEELKCTSQQPPSALSRHLLEEQRKALSEVLQDEQLLYLESKGASILKELEERRVQGNPDYAEAVEKSKVLYRQLKKVVGRLSRLADKRLSRLQECLALRAIEEESSQVLTWLNRKGEETLKRHKTLAETLNAIREQENEFEKFYFLAMRQIERGNDLLEEIPKVVREVGNEDGNLSSHLRRQLDDFTDRLEDAREKLEDTSRCYHLLDKTYEWSLETMRFVSHMRVDPSTPVTALSAIARRLDAYLQTHPYIGDGVFEEMAHLAAKLGNDALVEQCQTARSKYDETVELISVRREALATAKERLDIDELSSVSESIDNLKIKPCLWNPLSQGAPYRTTSQTYLGSHSSNLGSQSLVGSYTSFPSSYYPPVSFRERLLQRKNRAEYNSKRGSLTEELFMRLNRSEADGLAKEEVGNGRRPSCPLVDLNESNLTDRPGRRSSLTNSLSNRTSPVDLNETNSTNGRTSLPISECSKRMDFSDSEASEKLGQELPSNLSRVLLRNGRVLPASSTSNLSSRSAELEGSVVRQRSIENEHNWRACEEDLKKYADEVREQNRVLEEMRVSGQQESVILRQKNLHDRRYSTSSYVSPSSNPDENRRTSPIVNSHLTRCASCSDFEELLSSSGKANSALEAMANNRTLKLIMMEMVQTERDYVKSLGYIIENYVPLLQSTTVSQQLRSQRNVIFGNLEKIYEFHNCYFLEELEQCETMPYSVGQCFLKYESQFYLYAMYNKNKPKSDSLMAEYGNNFFKKKQLELGDKMDLASYLLKPVQRMGKYALLLKQLLKECPETNSEHYNNLKAAEEMVRFQLRHGNDLLAMDALRECDVNIKEQGRLLRQEEFLVWQGKRKALRHVFLFEDLILFSKAKRMHGQEHYQYKSSIKTSDLGLTAQVGESPTKFEIWFRKCKAQDTYVLQAPSSSVKDAWVDELSTLLWKQAERNRNLRLEEMSSMGIGNKPCLDITPSRDQICDRSISLQQLNKVPRFRNSIAVSSSDNFNNNNNGTSAPNEPRRRPLSIISLLSSASSGEGQSTSTFYDTSRPLEEEGEETASTNDKRRSVAQQSQCSAESGIFMDLSTSGDSYAENVQRLKTVERCDSVISRTSYNSIEAVATETKPIETSTSTSSPCGLAV
ncbi:hypothetical protein JTE90_006895 [Oedothorax gibbosus]|uniref:Puratrophin-1 n=1 Tax=Oedothorax gibbosus TaxID=931172 RepID=A0AAV6VQ01_9ARAC|nr:hypothetical protein JTE90_006895 [Oedothorax gibbosus]